MKKYELVFETVEKARQFAIDLSVRLLKRLSDKKELMRAIKHIVSSNIQRHFREKTGPGGKWPPLSAITVELKSKGISRLGPPTRAAILMDPLIGTSEYYRSFDPDSRTYIIDKKGWTDTLTVHPTLAQVYNEIRRVNKSKYFRGAKVPARRVLWIDNIMKEEIEETVDLWIEDILDEMLG